jgi:hypothetical protein
MTRPNLNDAEFRELEELLNEYGDMFAMKSDDYRRTARIYHRIHMAEAQPIRQPPRRLPLKNQAEVGEMFNDMQ